MNNVKKYIIYFVRCIRRMRYFPWKIPLLDICTKTLSIFKIYNNFLLNNMDNAVRLFLEKNYGEFVDKHTSNSVVANNTSSGTIWTCWWQGVESAPPLVQKCIESIRSNAGTHPVVVITWENLSMYADIPEHILDLAKCGDISLTHLSDVLRMNLLFLHGGLWLDSTMFYASPLDESLWDLPFFSPSALTFGKTVCPFKRQDAFGCICLQMTQKEMPLYKCICDLYDHFFRKYPMELHYFFTDYICTFVVERLGIHNNAVISQEKGHFYIVMLDSDIEPIAFEDYPSVNFFQLTYKKNWDKYCKDGRLTVYGKLMEK